MDILTSTTFRQAVAAILVGVILQGGIIAFAALVIRHHIRRAVAVDHLAAIRALPWRDTDAIVLLAVFLGAQVLSAGAAALWARLSGIPPDDLHVPTLSLQITSFPLIALVVLALLARRRGIRAAAWFGVRDWRQTRGALGLGFIHYFAMMPFVALSTYLYNEFLRSIDYPLDQQPVLDLIMDAQSPGWLRLQIVVVAVTVVPLVEEAIFRGVFLPIALRRASPLAATAAVSFIFAALHMHIPSLAPLFILSMAFSAAYLQTGSLLVNTIMHALFNALSIALLLLMGDAALSAGLW